MGNRSNLRSYVLGSGWFFVASASIGAAAYWLYKASPELMTWSLPTLVLAWLAFVVIGNVAVPRALQSRSRLERMTADLQLRISEVMAVQVGESEALEIRVRGPLNQPKLILAKYGLSVIAVDGELDGGHAGEDIDFRSMAMGPLNKSAVPQSEVLVW